MLRAEFWGSIPLTMKLYDQTLDPVGRKHGMTRCEVDILLFLANNPPYDTASDVVSRRGLAKSHVSASVDRLVRGGYLAREHRDGNRKVIHLRLLDAAQGPVADGRAAQEQFFSILLRDFSAKEQAELRRLLDKIAANLRAAQ